MSKKIAIVTTGQPSTNPRMIKEYLALRQKGYEVKVIYSFWVNWASEADEKLFEKELNKADFILAGGSPAENRITYFLSRIFHKAGKITAGLLPFFFRQWTLARPSMFLYLKLLRYPADLYIAHNLGALPAAWLCAKKRHVKVIFDAEDYHRGEWKNKADKSYKTATSIENRYIPYCHAVTAASPLIAAAYERLYPGIRTVVINNVFSKDFLQPVSLSMKKELTVFWFSQTIGSDRGLEILVQAVELLQDNCDIQVYLMGKVSDQYRNELIELVSRKEIFHFIEPVPPSVIFKMASTFDIGLASEIPHTENRNYCLTNKIFTYLLAGNCIVASATDAQADFFKKYPDAGFVYPAEDFRSLGRLLEHLYHNRQDLNKVRAYNQQLAAGELNWEKEQRCLLDLIGFLA